MGVNGSGLPTAGYVGASESFEMIKIEQWKQLANNQLTSFWDISIKLIKTADCSNACAAASSFQKEFSKLVAPFKSR